MVLLLRRKVQDAGFTLSVENDKLQDLLQPLKGVMIIIALTYLYIYTHFFFQILLLSKEHQTSLIDGLVENAVTNQTNRVHKSATISKASLLMLTWKDFKVFLIINKTLGD